MALNQLPLQQQQPNFVSYNPHGGVNEQLLLDNMHADLTHGGQRGPYSNHIVFMLLMFDNSGF